MYASQISRCPFCASKGAFLKEVVASRWAVICDFCGGIGPVAEDQADSIDQWNMRLCPPRNPGLAGGGVE
jgi:hypothetical protein